MGLGLNKILFDGMLFKILKKDGLPHWARHKRTKYSMTTLASLFLTLILIENQMGCLLFHWVSHVKKGMGTRQMGVVSFCPLFHSLYWKFEKLYDNNARKYFLMGILFKTLWQERECLSTFLSCDLMSWRIIIFISITLYTHINYFHI